MDAPPGLHELHVSERPCAGDELPLRHWTFRTIRGPVRDLRGGLIRRRCGNERVQRVSPAYSGAAGQRRVERVPVPPRVLRSSSGQPALCI
jgi:hypothetical protein